MLDNKDNNNTRVTIAGLCLRGRKTGKKESELPSRLPWGESSHPVRMAQGGCLGETSQVKQEDKEELARQEQGMGGLCSSAPLVIPLHFLKNVPFTFSFRQISSERNEILGSFHKPDSFFWCQLWGEATKLISIWSVPLSLWNYVLANLKNKILLKPVKSFRHVKCCFAPTYNVDIKMHHNNKRGQNLRAHYHRPV